MILQEVLDQALRELAPLGGRHCRDLGHQRADQRDRARVGHQLVGGRVEDHGQGVEPDVPQQLAPARADEVLIEQSGSPRSREVLGDGAHDGRDPSSGIARGMHGDGQGAEVEMRHTPRAGSLGAQEGEPTEDLATGGGRGVRGLHPDAVLCEQDPRARSQQSVGVIGQARKDVRVGRRLHGHDQDVAWPEVHPVGGHGHVVEVDVALGGGEVQPVGAHLLEAGPHEELHLRARMGQPDAVEAADRTGPDHRVSQHALILPRPRIRSWPRTPPPPSGPPASGGCCAGCARRAVRG